MKSKTWFIEYLRIISAFAVVLIHAASDLSFKYGRVSNTQWWAANLISSATHWAVPIFIMISGYLLLEPRRSLRTKKFYLTRLKRIGVPLFSWVFIYAIYYHFTRQDPLLLNYVIKRFIFDQPYEHLYFLIVLLQLALITPFLAKTIKSLSTKYLGWLTFGSLFISTFWKPWRFIVPLFVPYLGFYLGGYWLKKRKPYLKTRSFLLALFTPTVIASVGTYLLVSNSSPDRDGLYFYTYFNPITILLSFSIFTFFQNRQKKLITNNLISIISSTTLGVYLIHPIVMGWFGFIPIPNYFILTVLMLILKSSLVFLISVLITAIYRRMKLAILRE